MRSLIVSLVLVALSFWNFGLAEAASAPEINVLQDRGSSITIEFKLNGYEIKSVNINGTLCSRVIVPGHMNSFLEKGYPELPKFARSIIVPDDGLMNFRIVDVEYEMVKVDPVVSSKGNLKRNIDPATVPYTWSECYEKDEWFPEQNIELSGAYILRDFRGQTVRFNPFQYNSVKGELKIAKRIVVEVYRESSGGNNVLIRKNNIISRAFSEIYENFFLNYASVRSRYPFLYDTLGNMLIISADGYYDDMADFIYWKKKKGIPVEICNVSAIGNTSAQIKAYIQNKYDNEGVTWVLLVGNESDVTTITGSFDETCDPVYAYLAGSDNYLDAFISRFSANAEVHVDNQVERSVKYERYPQDGADWYHKGLATATHEGSPADSTRANWLRDTLLGYTYTEVTKVYESWGTDAMITNALNNGRSILDHIGHGNETGFGSLTAFWFDINDIANLNNTDMLPYVFLVACLTGDFDAVTTCCCEAFLWDGTPAAPQGGIAAYGASVLQSWVPPTLAQNHAMGILKREEAVTIGGLAFNGAMYMLDQTGDLEMLETWHIFGDASIDLMTDTPDTLDVTHDAFVAPGPTTFTVTVKDNDGVTLLEDALVALWIYTQSPELHTAGYTDAAGEITFNISPANVDDTMWVTVTKHNYKPYEGYALVEDAGVPDIPTIIKPLDFARLPNVQPTLSFYSNDPQAEDIQYRVLWDTDPNFGSPDSSTTPTYASGAVVDFTFPAPLTDGETYWWKVKCTDPGGSGYWTSYTTKRSFTIGVSLPVSTCSWYQTTAAQFNFNTFDGTMVQGDSVVIAMNNLTTLLDEGFEAVTFPPTGWAKFAGPANSSTRDWARKTDQFHTGSASAGINYDGSNTVDRFLVTEKLSLKNVADARLVFWSRDNWASYYMYHGLWASTNSQTNPADFTEVASIPPTAEDTWEERTIDISAYDGSDSVYFAFRYNELDGTDWWVDDVKITGYAKGDSGTMTGVGVVFNDLSTTYARAHWGDMVWHKASSGDSIGIQVEYYNGSWQLIPDGDLSGNSTGFYTISAIDTVDLSGLDTVTYNTIRLYGLFYCKATDAPDDPALLDWEVGNFANYIGIAEGESGMGGISPMLRVYPSITNSRLNIFFATGNPEAEFDLKIYDVAGRLVKNFVLPTSDFSLPTSVVWDRTDDVGRKVSAGVYFVRFVVNPVGETEDYEKIEKAVLLR